MARAILAQHGGGEEPIASILEQGAPAIAAIFGVLKAGKFYVSLDPTFPHAHLTAMLEDSQSSLLVTNNAQAALAEQLANDRCRILNSDTLNVGLSPAHLGVASSPNVLLHLLYTAGSTEQPKKCGSELSQRLASSHEADQSLQYLLRRLWHASSLLEYSCSDE
jgi:non-ribosomal peptide synthetase component F